MVGQWIATSIHIFVQHLATKWTKATYIGPQLVVMHIVCTMRVIGLVPSGALVCPLTPLAGPSVIPRQPECNNPGPNIASIQFLTSFLVWALAVHFVCMSHLIEQENNKPSQNFAKSRFNHHASYSGAWTLALWANGGPGDWGKTCHKDGLCGSSGVHQIWLETRQNPHVLCGKPPLVLWLRSSVAGVTVLPCNTACNCGAFWCLGLPPHSPGLF